MTVDLDSMEAATRKCVMDAFHAYTECALWSSTDEAGYPLDETYDVADISPESRDEMLTDVHDFLSSCWDAGIDLSGIEPGQFGHDFWLTRNHHGTGFWDRGLGDLGETLTEMADAYGSAYLYEGDDGRLHIG